MFLYDYCKREKNEYYVAASNDKCWVFMLIVCQIRGMFILVWLG
ncbi:hypothetical protein GYO_1050 [Bacillus spizizenii TU-B-10]|uniref:Uncharacterized protein n=1 Tax=Bacillus spizizenii (strain DSM 15029 / JCM 12233 / NBRC 101239 / NRRL B-23049 / TU-B-10) TaxID=1052585 RepID=G4NUE2_BACS4|nr:hypothetical protein GYO_1050 [Bacillus spizizenii TU-B-10]